MRPALIAPEAARSERTFVLGHRPALDGLRGLAILAVMLVHSAPALGPGGYFGVDLFFVLSGFLITALLLEEHRTRGSIDLPAFYLRRILRLLPAIVALLLVCWSAAWLFRSAGNARAIRHDAVSMLLYFYNLWVFLDPGPHPHYLLHFWSLSLEEQFYFTWPPLLAFLLARSTRLRWIMALVLVGATAPAVERLVMYHAELSGPRGGMRMYVCPDTHSDGIFLGALVALLSYAGWSAQTARSRGLLRLAALLAFLVLVAHVLRAPGLAHPYTYAGGLSVVNACSAVLIAALVWAPPRWLAWGLERRGLVWLGRVSYGLYLWHWPVVWLLRAVLPLSSTFMQIVVYVPPAVAVAATSYYLVERPFLA